MSDKGKRPPLPSRDGGGSFTINNPDDGSPIRQMVSLGEWLLLVTDKCTYRVQMADQVDPKRTNPNLAPNFQQKLFDHGIDSPLLSRSLLHARAMFRKEFQSIDVDRALALALESASNLVWMKETADDFEARQRAAIAKVEALERKDRSQILPAVGNVLEDCKSFCQKADHFSIALLEIVRLFYPEAKNWSAFQEMIAKAHEPKDPFNNLMITMGPLLVLLRDTRDCLDHRLPGVVVTDFAANADGTISPPSIEISYRKSKQPRMDVSAFMQQATAALLDAFEMITVNACALHNKPFAGIQMAIDYVPENYRASWGSRFAYGSYMEDGTFIVCG